MKALVTGANGTVGRALTRYLTRQGAICIPWDRSAVPIDRYHAMEHFVKTQAPDVVYHLATVSQPTGRENEGWVVNYEWTGELAWITRVLDIPFIFTSSVMVFTEDNPGPYTVDSRPDAMHDYGHEKRMAEERTFYQNPKAVVARLGWQIGDAPGSNNMVDFLHQEMATHGQIKASRKWLPACSFLEDTAAALYRLAQGASGLYLLDSNVKWSFYEIVTALNSLHGGGWIVRPDDSFVYDQRMTDPRAGMPGLNLRLPALR